MTAPPPFHTEQHIGVYYAFVEATLRAQSLRDMEHFLADNFVEHHAEGDRSRAQFLTSIRERRDRFPAAVLTIELLSGLGAMVVCHSTMVSGLPDGNRLKTQETAVVRFEDGKMVECWRTDTSDRMRR